MKTSQPMQGFQTTFTASRPRLTVGAALGLACGIAIAATVIGCSAHEEVIAVEWEHGFKTDYVLATRYKDSAFGYNISFIFPRQPYDSDRAETFEFLSANGCHVFVGGGAPAAPLYAKCDGVTDKKTANVLLKALLPKLDAHMRNLR